MGLGHIEALIIVYKCFMRFASALLKVIAKFFTTTTPTPTTPE